MYFDKRLWAFTKGFRARIWTSVALGVASSGLGVARLALLGWLLAKVFTGAPMSEMLWSGLLVAVIILGRGILEYSRTMIAHVTAARVQRHLRSVLFDKVVALGPAYFGHARTGDVMVTLIDGVEHLETYFGKYLPQFFISAVTPLMIFSFLALVDIWVASVLFFFAIFTLLAPAIFHRWDSRNSLLRSQAYGEMAAEFLDSLQGLSTLKVFGQSENRGKLLAERSDRVFKTTMWVLATNSLSRGITDTGIALGAALALAVGAYRVSEGLMSFEILLVILMLGVEVFRPLRDLRSLLHDGMLAQSAAKKILSLLDAKASISDNKDTASSGADLEPDVVFCEVDFSYPHGRGATHHGLDFHVKAGERVGFVGSSGAGKSTIVKLLLRLYDPNGGYISIGGRDIRELSFRELRHQFAIVQQDTQLFHGSVRDNLIFGNPQASGEEIEAAARAANAHDFIRALPNGYNTIVGERGIRLSGGQRQRIAIARALLRDAPILILDEALSAVDAENEAIIQEALDRLMVGRTTLIFAHRLSSVIDADRILVVEDGRISEEGSHDQLLAAAGTYFRLMAEQVKDQGGEAVGVRLIGDVAGEAAPVFAEESPIGALQEDEIVTSDGLGWIGAVKYLLKFAADWRGRLLATFGLGIVRVASFIGVGLFSALAVAALAGNHDPFIFLVLLVILAPMAGIFHWLESWLAHDMAFQLLSDMRKDLFAKIDSLAPAYMVRRRTGDLMSMATNDVDLVEYFFAHTITPAFVAILVPATVLFTLAAFHIGLVAALIPFLGVVAISPFVLRRRIDHLASRDREALGSLNAHTAESIQGLTEIVAFEQEAGRKNEFMALVDRHQNVRLPFFGELTIQTVLVEVATTFGGLSVVIVGGLLVEGTALASYLPLLTLLAMAAFLPISEIAEIGRQLADTLGATRRLHNLYVEEPAVVDGVLPLPASNGRGLAVQFEDVSFEYPGTDRPAVQGVSFRLEPGETAAIVGRSGAGKTTLAHLLLRFWDPNNGDIFLDGNPLSGYLLNDMRGSVALVAQDTYLFNATLGSNIRMAKPEASDEELAGAVRRAALEEFVVSLPDGLDTPVGERGMALSGGQRQRVAIARAFLSDAPVLVLDEATSHLDALNERLVHRALRDLMKDRTTLVIAHRLSTVRDADQIVTLDLGRVVECGSHHELLLKGGLYASLVNRQITAAAE